MDAEVYRIYVSPDPEFAADHATARSPIDVVVQLNNGSQYMASFVLYDGIEGLRVQHRQQKEFLNGRYWWCKNMILIDSYDRELIEEVIGDLLEEGSFWEAFEKV